MKNLFKIADQYIEESNWKTLAMVKFCLCAIGILIGFCIPKGKRKNVAFCAGMVFLVTYVPLMKKFFDIVQEQ